MQVAVSATAELQVAVQQRSCSGTAGGGDSAGGAAVEKNTVALQVEQQCRIEEAAAGAAAFEWSSVQEAAAVEQRAGGSVRCEGSMQEQLQ
jgi:hypothetical protein